MPKQITLQNTVGYVTLKLKTQETANFNEYMLKTPDYCSRCVCTDNMALINYLFSRESFKILNIFELFLHISVAIYD